MNYTNGQHGIYPTRGQTERLIERKDPILYGYRHLAEGLNDEELTQYGNRGFLILPNAFSKSEISALYSEVKLQSKRRKYCYMKDNGQMQPDNSKNLFDMHKMSERILKFTREKKITHKVKQILGSDVYLHQSQINIADEKTGISYPWHSQFERWYAEHGVPRMRCMEAWVMLTESTMHNGAMCLLDRSHNIFVSCAQADGPSRETLTRLLGFGGVTNAYVTAGTLVLCDGNLMCGMTKSVVSSPRAIAMFSYNSVENRPLEERAPENEMEWETSLPMPVGATYAKTAA